MKQKMAEDNRLEQLMEVDLPAQGEVIREYDERFACNPQIWADSDHDAYVFELLECFARCQERSLVGELLDVGCGSGHTLRYFAARSRGRLRLTGLDFSQEAVRLARSQGEDVEVLCTDFLSWEPARKFDFVISLGVFEHFPDPRPALRKVGALLKEQGVFCLEVPNCLWHGWSGRHEGFRRHAGGSGQLELHLRRPTWDQSIAEAGLYTLAAMQGPTPWTEFIWFLGSSPWADTSQCANLQRFCRRRPRRAWRRHVRHFIKIQKQSGKMVLEQVLGRLGVLAITTL